MTSTMRILAAGLAVPAIAGCGGGGRAGTTATSPPRTGPPGGLERDARVEITSPREGATTAPVVTARVALTGVRLAPRSVGQTAREGEGHLHFSLDGGRYDRPRYSGANGRLAVRLGVQGSYSPAVLPTITYMNLPPGRHRLEVRLANNDHTNAGPTDAVEFTVKR